MPAPPSAVMAAVRARGALPTLDGAALVAAAVRAAVDGRAPRRTIAAVARAAVAAAASAATAMPREQTAGEKDDEDVKDKKPNPMSEAKVERRRRRRRRLAERRAAGRAGPPAADIGVGEAPGAGTGTVGAGGGGGELVPMMLDGGGCSTLACELTDDEWADGMGRSDARRVAPRIEGPPPEVAVEAKGKGKVKCKAAAAEAEERTALIASIRLTFPLIAGADDLFAEDKLIAFPVEYLQYLAACQK